MNAGIKTYLECVQDSISDVNLEQMATMVDVLFQAFSAGQTVYTMGNGASAALAAHMACDLGKGTATDIGQGTGNLGAPRLRIISLTDNVALMTAYGNDVAYQDIFLEQLKGLLRPADVVLGISGSGGSPNVLRAMEYARTVGAWTLGMTGSQPTSRRMADLCDVCLQAPLTMMEQIEDLHVMFSHAIAVTLRARIADFVATTTPDKQDRQPLAAIAAIGPPPTGGDLGRVASGS